MTSLAGSKTTRLQRPGRGPTIADLVEVTAVETVVRLDGRPGRLSELVLTADVAAALSAVLGATRRGRGEAFFLVGHFGSGKSHLLAALAELVGGPSRELPAGWDLSLREAAGALGPALAVAIPLVEHRAGAVLEDLVLSKAWEGLGRPVGQQPPAGTDRRAAWDTLLSAAAGTGRGTWAQRRAYAARCSRGECCRAGPGWGDRSVPVGTLSPPRGACARGAAGGVFLVGRLVD
ncbi:MAG: hypothetical protein JWM17_2817 [Actinobacteria bacterium]|nr:hypothetical protein [Actinomycetota bacterium]